MVLGGCKSFLILVTTYRVNINSVCSQKLFRLLSTLIGGVVVWGGGGLSTEGNHTFS